ncbi:MAG: MFS transporter [Clostridiales Family XIII bacterium]|nr:MFS transporter [Clostridiales Family XIII bacterium]
MAQLTMLPAITTLSLFVVPLSESLGVSRAEVSLMYTTSAFTAIFIALAVGFVLKKVSPKVVVVIGGVSVLIFLMALSFSDSMPLIWAAGCLKGVAGIASGMTMAQIVLSQWFHKGRGTILSFVPVMQGLFGAIANPLFARFIETYGYRPVAFWEAVVFGGMIILIGIFCIEGAPEKIGYKPYGYEEHTPAAAPAAENTEAKKAVIHVPGLSIGQIVSFPAFWAILIATTFASLAAQAFGSQGSPYFQSIGLTAVEAAVALSAFNIGGIGWNLLYGVVNDKFGTSIATLINGTSFALALLLAYVWNGMTMAMICAVMLGAQGALTSTLGPVTATRLFGTKEAGLMVGWIRAFSSVGSMLGPVLAGFMFDRTGNYSACYTIIGVGIVIAVAIALWANSKSTQIKVQAKIHVKMAAGQ